MAQIEAAQISAGLVARSCVSYVEPKAPSGVWMARINMGFGRSYR